MIRDLLRELCTAHVNINDVSMDGNTYALAKEAINRAYKLGIPVLNYCAQLEIQAEHQWATISKLERSLRETEERVAKEMAEAVESAYEQFRTTPTMSLSLTADNLIKQWKESKGK